jgi:DNA-binding NarL/FixJ family response regulator
MARGKLRIALLNDYDVVVAGLATMLADLHDRVEVVDVSITLPTEDAPLDVVLLDTFGVAGLDLDRLQATAAQPNVGSVAVYSFNFQPAQVDAALSHGATGYLWKGLPGGALVADLERVADGAVVVSETRPHTHPLRTPEADWPGRDRGLTTRESEALILLAQGLTNRAIAKAMYVSVDTVKTHLRNVYRKLDLRNRAEAVAYTLSAPSFSNRTRDLVGMDTRRFDADRETRVAS